MYTMKTIIAGIIGLTIAGVSVGWGVKRIQSHANTTVELLGSDRSPASVKPVSEPEESNTGRVEVYGFERTVEIQLQTQKGKREPVKTKLKGEFSVRWNVLKGQAPGGSAWFGFKVSDGKEYRASRVPFLVIFGEDYDVQEIQTISSSDEEAQDEINLLKDLVSLYAYRSDRDTTGEYLASFQKNGNEIVKEKTQYTKSEFLNVNIIRSKHRIRLDSAKRVVRAEGSEVTRLKSGNSVQIQSKSSYVFQRSDSTEAHAVVNLNGLKVSHIDEHEKSSKPVQPWSVLIEGLEKIAVLDRAGRIELFHDLVASGKIDQDSSIMAPFMAWLKVHAGEPGVLQFGIGVLASVGSERAQSELIRIFNEHPEQHHTVLNAFSTAQAPQSSESFEFLKKLAEGSASPEVAYNASFALGSGIRMLPNASAVKSLKGLLASAKDTQAQLYYLDAIGNSGHEGFLSVISQYVMATNPAIREKAVMALRFMKPEASQKLVFESWGDASERVKFATIRVIAHQGSPDVYQGVLQECAHLRVEDANSALKTLSSTCQRMLSN